MAAEIRRHGLAVAKGRSFSPNSTMIAMLPTTSGMPTRANSKKLKPAKPESCAASDTSTLTGDPVSASSEPA